MFFQSSELFGGHSHRQQGEININFKENYQGKKKVINWVNREGSGGVWLFGGGMCKVELMKSRFAWSCVQCHLNLKPQSVFHSPHPRHDPIKGS